MKYIRGVVSAISIIDAYFGVGLAGSIDCGDATFEEQIPLLLVCGAVAIACIIVLELCDRVEGEERGRVAPRLIATRRGSELPGEKTRGNSGSSRQRSGVSVMNDMPVAYQNASVTEPQQTADPYNKTRGKETGTWAKNLRREGRR